MHADALTAADAVAAGACSQELDSEVHELKKGDPLTEAARQADARRTQLLLDTVCTLEEELRVLKVKKIALFQSQAPFFLPLSLSLSLSLSLPLFLFYITHDFFCFTS